MNRGPPFPSRLAVLVVTLVAAMGLLPADLAGQSAVHGIVVEDGNDRPIGVVDLRLLRSDGQMIARAFSEDDGRFRMEVADTGSFTLTVTRVGYRPVSADSIRVFEDDDLELQIRLDPLAVALEAVTVVTQRRAVPGRILRFRERAEYNQRIGNGRIWTREDLATLRPNHAQEVLDRVLWSNRCEPLVLLDGLPYEGRMTMLAGEDVEGIEIYRGVTQIPAEYYRYGMCGLAMVWSRHDPPGMRPLTWKRAAAAGVIVVLIGLIAR